MNRADILKAVREIQQDPALGDITLEEAMLIYLIEVNEVMVARLMTIITEQIERDPRTNFSYAFLTAAWQAAKEFTVTFGNYLESRKNKKR